MRIDPRLVAPLRGPFAIKRPHRLGILGINPVLTGQALNLLPIRLVRIAVDEGLERRIGCDDRRLNPEVLAFAQAVLLQGAQNEDKDLVINLLAQPLAE